MADMNTTYGALFVGVLVSAVLFGVTMLQAFVYFSQYPADRVWGKLAVCWLWFLDALHLALSAHFVYVYLVVNYDRPSVLLNMIWSFKLRTVVDGLVVVSVHTLYTCRLWTLLRIDNHVKPFGKEDRRWSDQKVTKSEGAWRWLMCKVVPWLVSGLVVIGYGITIVMCFETFRLDTFERLSRAPWATYIPFCFSAVIDIVIAGSLCYFLSRCRTESGKMNGPIRTLMVYTVNTGIISSFCSLIAIATMIAFPKTFISIALEILVIKLYINSYLALVNARGGFQQEYDRRMHSAYTPNTSIALRDVVQFPHKSIPFPTLPLPIHCAEDGREVDIEARKSADLRSTAAHHDIVVDLSPAPAPPACSAGFAGSATPASSPPAEQYLHQSMQAPRIRQAGICPEYGVVDSHPHPRLLAERLSLTPLPPSSTSTSPRSSQSSPSRYSPISVPHDPSSPSPPSPTASSRAEPSSPLTPTRSSSPFPFSSPSPATPYLHPSSACASLELPMQQDYPSPPERSRMLSPLKFGSPPESTSSSPTTTDSDADESLDEILRFSSEARRDWGREKKREDEKDRYTRMVRTARSRGKERRALLNERGVAILWAPPDDAPESNQQQEQEGEHTPSKCDSVAVEESC